jgi:C-methyltransferase./Methyltransferase domain./Hypothetical methyltransferase.
MKQITRRTVCRICEAELGIPVFTLGSMPLANALLFEKDLDEPEPSFPLDVHHCDRCGLAQLGIVVDPEKMFCNYTFFTGSSGPSIAHFSGLAEELRRRYCVEGDFAVEIGSNDGTLTGKLAQHGLKVLGVDGASNCVAAARKNHPNALFYDGFFNSDVAELIKKEHGQARVIVACNVVAHIDDVNDLMKGVDRILARDAVFVIEVPSLERLIDHLCYDTIYHEHLSYFNASALDFWASQHGMYVDEVQEIDTHGGSIRVFIKRREIAPSPMRYEVQNIIEKERKSGCAERDTWKAFTSRAAQQRERLVRTLYAICSETNQRIMGYGAPAKATVLLNYCRIGTNIMNFCADTTPAKIGRYIPGARIRIVSKQELYRNESDFALMHCWNYRDAVLRNEHEWIERGGTFIVPFPDVEMIQAGNLRNALSLDSR